MQNDSYNGFAALRPMFKLGLFLSRLLEYLGQFLNRLIFEGSPFFEERRNVKLPLKLVRTKSQALIIMQPWLYEVNGTDAISCVLFHAAMS